MCVVVRSRRARSLFHTSVLALCSRSRTLVSFSHSGLALYLARCSRTLFSHSILALYSRTLFSLLHSFCTWMLHVELRQLACLPLSFPPTKKTKQLPPALYQIPSLHPPHPSTHSNPLLFDHIVAKDGNARRPLRCRHHQHLLAGQRDAKRSGGCQASATRRPLGNAPRHSCQCVALGADTKDTAALGHVDDRLLAPFYAKVGAHGRHVALLLGRLD